MNGRRGLTTAVLLCLLGAFALLVGVGRAWSEVVVTDPLTGSRTLAVTGTQLAGGVRALGLVGLAGVVALAATRRWGRPVVGALLLLAGAGVIAAVLGVDPGPDAVRALAAQGARDGDDVATTAWPYVTAGGGVLLAAAGLLTLRHGRSWPALGQRYEAPGARVQASQQTPAQAERALWEALDRGEDPTST